MKEFIEKIKQEHAKIHELVLAIQEEGKTLDKERVIGNLKILNVPLGYQVQMCGLIGMLVYNEDPYSYSSHVNDVIWYKTTTFVDYVSGEESEIIKFSELSEEFLFQQSLIMNQDSQYYYILFSMCLEYGTPHFKLNTGMNIPNTFYKEYFENKNEL